MQNEQLNPKASVKFQKPPDGNFTIYCTIYDSWQAKITVAKDLIVEEVVLTEEKENEIFAGMTTNSDTGDSSGGKQLAGNLASAVNSQKAKAGRRRLSASEVAAAAARRAA